MTFPRASVQHQLLFQHEVLHALLGRLAEAAERTVQGKPAAQELRDAARSLQVVMEAHVDQEELLLGPLLSRGSPHRLQQLRADHRRGLEMLRKLSTRPPGQAAVEYQRVVPLLVAAIERESREILEPVRSPSGSRPNRARNTA